jgi:hypothetical protein
MTLLGIIIATGFLYAALRLRVSVAPSKARLQDADGPWVGIVQSDNWDGPILLWHGYYEDPEFANNAAAAEGMRLDTSVDGRPGSSLSIRVEDRRLFERRLVFGYQRSLLWPRQFAQAAGQRPAPS